MRDVFMVLGPVAFLAGAVMHALAQAHFENAADHLADARDLLDRSGKLHAETLRLASAGEKVNGPAALARLLAKRFDLEPDLAGAIANTAVWHFESPLAVAAVDPRRRHPWQEGAR